MYLERGRQRMKEQEDVVFKNPSGHRMQECALYTHFYLL